jgi:IMP dehydrogenase
MKLYKNSTLCFDDILLVPQYSDVASRKEVDISAHIGGGGKGISMSIPVIAAPMDTVCDGKMAYAIRKLGGFGIMHRYMSIDEMREELTFIRSTDPVSLGVAVGAKGDYLERAFAAVSNGAHLILVDTANGHSEYAINAVKEVRRNIGNKVHIMAGNVSTYDGFMRLNDAGADSIRVGIGGGSVCTTRIVSGHGMPTLASILDIRSRLTYGDGASIVADGGIRNSGDAVKALAAGADVVMLGSYLAGTDESPGEVYRSEGKKFKIFRGMASAEAQISAKGTVSVAEGVETTVPYKGSLEKILEEFKGGIGSGLSYTGAHNLKELHEDSMFIKVSQASLSESRPHAAH